MEMSYINREISWLSFNERVLQEAEDRAVPLIQRLRFLGIFSNNRDEFFRVRVASVSRMLHVRKSVKKITGHDPKKVLNRIRERVLLQQHRFEECYKDILKEMELHKIFMINEKQLGVQHGKIVKEYFYNRVRPMLVPIMLDQAPSFPSLKDKLIYLAVKLTKKDSNVAPRYAIIEIPTDSISRFFILPMTTKKRHYIIMLDDIIRYSLDDIFSIFEYDQIEAYNIKVTRDAELDIDDDISKSFIEKMSSSLEQRKIGDPVRFVYDATIPEDVLKLFIDQSSFDEDDSLIPGGRYHNSKDFMDFPSVGSKNLEYPPLKTLPHKHLKPYTSSFAAIKQRDMLVNYPYQSFNHFIDFLREAAIDENVTSIKITAYRLAKKSNVINALINAARNGKEITVVMEIQARFDEEANINWTRQLQEEGIKVIQGVPGLKVHAKLCQITRIESGKEVRYVNVSTGNFNESTSKVYTDISLFTCDERITSEVNQVFDFLETNYKVYNYEHLLVSPHYLKKALTDLIEEEIENAKLGKKAEIKIKINNLVDESIIDKLYEASQAGVEIKMIIRGICSLIPGKKGLSENIKVISIIDNFLEHSRLLIFHNNGNPKYFIASADLMSRNLDNRVEVVCPVYDKTLQNILLKMFNIHWSDNVKARIIDEEQTNPYKSFSREKAKRVRSQEAVYEFLKLHQ